MVSCFINFGLLYIVLGCLGLFEGFRLINVTGIAYGPGQYVAVISGLILLGGIVYYIEEVKNAKKGVAEKSAVPQEEETPPEELPKGVAPSFKLSFRLGGRAVEIGPVILAFLLFFLYGVITGLVGYLVSTALFVATAMLLFGERIWWKIAIFAVVTGVTFWFVFIRFASIPLK